MRKRSRIGSATGIAGRPPSKPPNGRRPRPPKPSNAAGSGSTPGFSTGSIRGPTTPPKKPRWRSTKLRSEEHTSELQSLRHLVCRLLLEKKNGYARPEKHTTELTSLKHLVCRLLLT